MTTNIAFWDSEADKYAAKPIADIPAYEAKLARMRQLLKPGQRVLELGCGSGGTARALAPCVSQIVATDISTAMIAIAKKRQRDEGISNVSFRCARADEEHTGGPFDVVCAFSLLHLVPDLEASLERIRAALKPGGLFVSKTVCMGERSALLRGLVRLLTFIGRAPEVAVLTRSSFVAAMEGSGFEILEVSHFADQAASPFIVARRSA